MIKNFFILLICILWIPLVTAQDSRSNLLDMLEAIPDSLENRESLISYIDYRAMETARPGAAIYEKLSEMMTSEGSLADGLFMAALRGVSSGPDFMTYLFSSGELWEETVGFDFFDIDRALTFGNPPAHVTILAGDFDTDAIASALTNLDYTSDTLGDFGLWCGAVGCDEGTKIDVKNRNLGNPFGGDLGRQQPVIASDTMVMSSPAFPVLILSEDAVTDKLDSIADNLAYLAAVNSINPDNILIQANFVYFTQIIPYSGLDTEIEVLEARMEELANLPQYELLLMADTATETEQVATITLVYSTLEDAETATVVVPERLATMDSLRFVRSLQEIFEDRGVSEITTSAVLDDATDKALAIFEFHAPLASDTEEDGLGFVQSSMVYRVFVDMLYSRDTDWLVAGMDGS